MCNARNVSLQQILPTFKSCWAPEGGETVAAGLLSKVLLQSVPAFPQSLTLSPNYLLEVDKSQWQARAGLFFEGRVQNELPNMYEISQKFKAILL